MNFPLKSPVVIYSHCEALKGGTRCDLQGCLGREALALRTGPLHGLTVDQFTDHHKCGSVTEPVCPPLTIQLPTWHSAKPSGEKILAGCGPWTLNLLGPRTVKNDQPAASRERSKQMKPQVHLEGRRLVLKDVQRGPSCMACRVSWFLPAGECVLEPALQHPLAPWF